MTTKSKDIFRENAAAYWARGLPVIPLHPRQKYPVIEGWSLYANQLPDAEVQAAWMEDYADGNIGLPLGPQSGLMMLDVDTDDPKILRLVEELLPPSPWKRIGAKGFAQQYGDYILMYSALAGEDARVKALDELRKFDKSKIDDGNTYSYTLAWLLSLKP